MIVAAPMRRRPHVSFAINLLACALVWPVALAVSSEPIPPTAQGPRDAKEAATGLRIIQRDRLPAEVGSFGTIVIETDPSECTIDIPQLKLAKQRKEKEQWELQGVPEGAYFALISATERKSTSVTIDVKGGETIRVRVVMPPVTETANPRLSEPQATSKIGRSFSLQSPRLRMIWVDEGTFIMGGAGGNRDELPATSVTITSGFWIGETEVTQSQWQSIMQSNPSDFRGDDRPVERVSWDDALDFCRRLTRQERAAGRLPLGFEFTLPTEAQWEYACRAGSAGSPPVNFDVAAWFNANSSRSTHPVATQESNPWGLYDMLGNVWEWCLDSKGTYKGGATSDPLNLSPAETKVYRGGSWYDSDSYCRPGYRNSSQRSLRWHTVGFRLALSKVRQAQSD